MSFKKREKFLEDLYQELNWEKSLYGVRGLIYTENECLTYFNTKYKGYIKRWEYGYYYLLLLFQNLKLGKSYSIIASLYSEALNSLRCSFLNNMNGYHPESISLLRRVHECCVKLMAGRAFPQKIWDIVQSPSLQKAESDLGINLKWINNIEGSYLHSNKLKLIDIGKKWNQISPIEIPYGLQPNDKEFIVSANLSIFWIYILTLIAPRLFTEQISGSWLSKYQISCKLFKDYLKESNKPINKLFQSLIEVENILDKIGPEKFDFEKKI